MNLPAKKQSDTDAMIEEVCKNEGITRQGITVMGGKPYINVTGLDQKIHNLCKKDNLVLVGTHYEEIERATEDNGVRAGGWGVVELFDKRGFESTIKAIGAVDTEILRELRKTYTHIFKMRGYASPDTVKMATMNNIDNLEMMAERRATNRAKREATGTGLTSSDEMAMNVDVAGKPEVATPQRKSVIPPEVTSKKVEKRIKSQEPPPPPEEQALDDIPPFPVEEREPQTDDEIRAKLSEILIGMAGKDLDKVPELIKFYSGFDGKDGRVETDSTAKLKGKWLKTTYGRAKEDWEREE